MTLPEKLDQLSLSTTSRQLETTISEAATKNLSVAATLEWLADMELEARNHRAIERRFKCSRLQAQPSIDSFQPCGMVEFPVKHALFLQSTPEHRSPRPTNCPNLLSITGPVYLPKSVNRRRSELPQFADKTVRSC
jgi:hypothetical protein